MKHYLEAEQVQLVYSGNNYFEVLEQVIDESRDTLHLQTYIFDNDETGWRIAEALKRAAQRHVKVFMLVDAYGSYPFSKKMLHELSHAGVHVRLFSPLFSSESIYFGRRLHHKIIVADKHVALTGGINIANKYSGADHKKAWLDYAVLTRGKACEYLHWLCEEFYWKKRSKRVKAWEKDRHASTGHQQLVRFRRNDWIKQENDIHKSYAEGLISAEKSIIIVASYFLPGGSFRKLLKSAAARGIDIKIILAGKSDIGSVRLAERYLYGFYLRNGIHIYEWTNSVMHGKAMVVDDVWATIGSYNLNMLSHYISIELNTDIKDNTFAGGFAAHLREIMQSNSVPVELKHEQPGFLLKSLLWLAYNFYRLLMAWLMNGRKYRKRKYI